MRLAVGLFLVAFVAEARGRPPRIEDVEQSLNQDRSYRIRVSAALVLGKLHQARSVPALVRALGDGHPAVRATAAQALGRIGDPSAGAALARAERDDSPMVRRMAGDARRSLRPPAPPIVNAPTARRARPAFEVKAMGDRSHRAGPALREHMREVLTNELLPVGDVASATDAPHGFVIDGVIKDLSLAMRRDHVEVTCAVQLVVSRQPSGGVFLLTSGEAMVQKPRRQFRSKHRSGMETEALEGAVRGASEDLRRHLAQQ
ncbi:MAG TPA: HEAT repeat domain-containing protein [Polyangia bacterium]|nr:HEAT repeat domain-containing protein [Polyangia bacterium]